MFKRNIQKISAILILLTVMIVAIGAVSAAEIPVTGSDGSVNSNIDTDTIISNSTNLIIAGNLTTDEATTHIPEGTPFNATFKKNTYYTDSPKICVDNNIYMDKQGTPVDTGKTIINGTNITLSNTGSFNATFTITDTNHKLVSGQNYFLQVNIANNTAAYYGNNSTNTYAVLSSSDVNLIEFIYLSPSAIITLDNNISNISYGDDWSFSGTLTNINGTKLAKEEIYLYVGKQQVDTIKTDTNGKFSINYSTYKTLSNIVDLNASTKAYTLTFYYNGVTANAYLNVAKKNVTLLSKINVTSAKLNDKVLYTVSLIDETGKLVNISYGFNDRTGFKYLVQDSNGKIVEDYDMHIINGTYLDDDFLGYGHDFQTGNYSITTYNKDNPNFNAKNTTVTLNILPSTNITTVLTINNFSELVGASKNLTGKLTNLNGDPIIGQKIALNLTRYSDGASKIYVVTTDTEGEFQLEINLAIGKYGVTATYPGFTSKDNITYSPAGPVKASLNVTSEPTPTDNRTSTVLTIKNYTGVYGTPKNLTGDLETINDVELIGQKIPLNLTRLSDGASKIYWVTTDTDGEFQLEINLYPGKYTVSSTFPGNKLYKPSNNANATITVKSK